MPAISDRNAIRIALEIAIDTEESLIDAYRNEFTGKVDESDLGVSIARRRIEAFKRVLSKRYPGCEMAKIDTGVPISIFKLMAGSKAAS